MSEPTEEAIAALAAAHVERMAAISAGAIAKAQEINKRMVDNLKDPLAVKADLLRMARGEGDDEPRRSDLDAPAAEPAAGPLGFVAR